MEWLGPLATVAAGGLVAWSINKNLGNVRTFKVREFGEELGPNERELQKQMKSLTEELKQLRKSRET